MKSLLLSFIMSACAVSAFAGGDEASKTVKIDQKISCGSHYFSTGIFEYEKMTLEDATKACSLTTALRLSRDVCEGEGYAGFRPKKETLKFVKSVIHETTCHKDENEFSCDTSMTVVCI
jgi:hypothetical protein